MMAVSLLMLVGCSTQRAMVRELEVRATLDGLASAENGANVPMAIGAWAEDGVLVPASGSPIEGVPALADHYRNLFREQQLDIRMRIDDVETRDDLAWASGVTVGSLRSKATGGERTIEDQWLAVLRRTSVGWEIARMIVRP